MATLLDGPKSVSMTRDRKGFRTYKITHQVRLDDYLNEGPLSVLLCPGLPSVGSVWTFGTSSPEADGFAWCTPEASVTPEVSDGPSSIWSVEQTFSSDFTSSRDSTDPIGNPLLEPADVSGSFIKYTREATHDKDGNPFLTVSHDRIRGPQVEFDESRPTVRVSFNSATLPTLMFSYINCVNSSTMWGLPARCIKYSSGSWSRRYYSVSSVYYNLVYEFDIMYETFDREILSESNKMLITPTSDPSDPANWVLRRSKETGDVETKIMRGVFTWEGPDSIYTPDTINLQKYPGVNLLLLGIPSVLG